MATADMMLTLFPRENAYLSDHVILTSFLLQMVQHEYLVVPFNRSHELLRQMYGTDAWKPDVISEVWDQAEAFSQGQKESFDCYLRHIPQTLEDCGLAFRFTIYAQESIIIDINDGMFKYDLLGFHNYEHFIQFIPFVYQTWPLYYSYMDDGFNMCEKEDVYNFRANYLYEITVFGSEYVTHLGPEKFEAVHPWKKLPMPDGGYILVLGSYAQYTQPELKLNAHDIAKTLGLTTQFFLDQ